MKSDVQTSNAQAFVQMERNVFNQWISEVKETLATDIDFPAMNKHKNKNAFGIVDLWKIRRGRRSAASQFRGIMIPNGMKY